MIITWLSKRASNDKNDSLLFKKKKTALCKGGLPLYNKMSFVNVLTQV